MKHLLWIVGVVALAPAFWYFNKFYTSPEDQGTGFLAYSGVFFVIALICFAAFIFQRFRAEGEQDISITKF